MKKMLSLLLIVMLIASSVSVFAEEAVTVTLNGEELSMEDKPILRGDSVFVPLRAVCDALGFDVKWDNETRTVKAIGLSITAEVEIGSAQVKKNGMPISVSAETFIDNGRTFVSSDALEALGASVSWDGNSNVLALSVDMIDGRSFRIVQASTGKAFAPENGLLNDNVRIVAADPDGSDLQVWKFNSRGNGRYNPINKKSQRSFDIPNAKLDLGLNLIQYGVTEGTNQWIEPVENGDGTYLLKCAHAEDLYLTVSEDGIIVQNELVGDETQIFILEEAVTETAAQDGTGEEAYSEEDLLGGKYYSILQEETEYAVSVIGNSVDSGAEIALDDAAVNDSMVWKLTAQGSGCYAIINKASGLALTAGGDTLTQTAVEYGEDQVFELIENGTGYLIKNQKSGLYLTVSGYMTLSLEELDENRAQSFILSNPLCSTDSYEKDQIGGRYYKITAADMGLAVSVENSSNDDSAKIIAEEASDSDYQIWSFITQGNGMYVIINKASGLSFDIPSSSTEEKTSLTQYTVNYGNNQIFELIDAGDGTYMFKNKNSGLYLTVADGYLRQEMLGRSNQQSFILTDMGETGEKMIGAAATLFVLNGEDKVSNAKVQWNSVTGATSYDVYRSVDGGYYNFLTAFTGTSLDDYDLEVGRSYSYAVYALEEGSLIDYAETKPVEPYDLPADLNHSSNLQESSMSTPNTLCIDGVYYRYSAWGRDDGGSGFGRLMMSTSTDDITYSEPVEVLNYKDILAHETCEGYESCRFESQNIRYNPVANRFVFIAHFEADGGYGTAKISFASGAPGEYFTFHGAVQYEGDDSRDLNVYVDDDNSAYIMAAVHNNADLALYKLNEDWSGIETRLCYVNRGKWRELPSMLKVDGIYYLFTSGTAGWYPTQGMYNTATSIEGPWSPLKAVGNTTTFSAQSGYVSSLKSGGENYIMNSYRWMYYWNDAIVKRTVQRRYPISVSNGYAFYDFFDDMLYNWENDDLVPVQNGRILSQNMPAKASSVSGDAGYVNDGNYQSYWYGEVESENEAEENTSWPFSWEVDLGKVCALSEIQVSWLIWNGSEPYYQYKVEASTDGVNYNVILDKTEGYTDYGFTVDELSGSARYVRLTVVNAKPRSSDKNTYPAQLYEVKVLGK